MCSCSLFFTAAHFCLGGHKHFSCFSSNKIGLFYFFLSLSLSLALSLLSTSIQTLKLSRKREQAFSLLFLSLKSPVGYAIYRRNVRVLEMQNFTPCYMKGWTDVRTILSEPKFVGCIGNQIFLPMVLPYFLIQQNKLTISIAGLITTRQSC